MTVFTSNQRPSRGHGRTAVIVVLLAAVAAVVFAGCSRSAPGPSQAQTAAPSPAHTQAQDLSAVIEQTVRIDAPDATVSDVRSAGGFAVASVADPAAGGQAAAGLAYIFKVNADGSVTQLAAGSAFDPLALLGLGVPVSTQAELNGQTVAQVMSYLCGSDATAANPGFAGFDQVRAANGTWAYAKGQIVLGDDTGLEYSLTQYVSAQNRGGGGDGQVICVVALGDAQVTIDNGFAQIAWNVQFVTGAGEATSHAMTTATGAGGKITTTVDGKPI